MTTQKTRTFKRPHACILFTLCLFAGLFFSSLSVHAASTLENSTKECLALLDSLSEEESRQLVGLDGLNITDEEYTIIRDYTLELTKNCEDTTSKIEAIYNHLASRTTADAGPAVEHDEATCNDPYPMFKNMRGVCQGFSNLGRTMLTALDIPCVISHGYYVWTNNQWEGHAWNYAYCDGHWGIVDGSTLNLNLTDPSSDDDLYKTVELEQDIYTENGLEFSYYDSGLGVVGYCGDADEIIIPESCHGHTVVSVSPQNTFTENSLMNTTAQRIVIPATVEYGIFSAPTSATGEYREIRPFLSTSLTEIEVAEDNPVYASYKGILYDKEFSQILSVPYAITDIELKPLTILDKNTLMDLPYLRTLKIAEGTEAICSSAVEQCPSLEKVSIPDSVTDIEENAFYGCSTDFTIYASEGSAAAAFAADSGLAVEDLSSFDPAADYTALNEALAEVPSDLTKYTEETVNALQQLIDAINWNCTAREQAEVDQTAEAIHQAVQNLKAKDTGTLLPPANTDTDTGIQTPPANTNTDTGIQTPPANTDTNTGIQSPPAEAPEPDTISAPKKVTGLKVTYKKSGKAVLSWKKLKGVTGYQVFRYQKGKWVKVKTLKNKARLTIKRQKKTYQYKIRAYRKAGTQTVYGAYSKKVKVRKS